MRWRFQLVNSKDMSRIGVLKQAKGRSVNVMVGKHGEAGFTYPLDGEYAANIIPYQTGILAERFNWRMTEARRQAGLYGQIWDPIWSGYVLPIAEDLTASRMTVSCIGWTGRLAKRLIRNRNMFWNNVDDGAIIRDILQHLNGLPAFGDPSYVVEHSAGVQSKLYVSPPGDGYTIWWPLGASPNTPTCLKWGGLLPDDGFGGSASYVPALRNFKVEQYNYGWPYIENLMNIENGCDIHVDPVQRTLSVHRRYRRVKDEIVIGFAGLPRNAAAFSRQNDADKIVNYFLAQGEAIVTPQFAHDLTSQTTIGPIEEVQQLGGVTDIGVLLAYAGAEILVRGNGVVTYGVTPFAYTPTNGVPEPFVEYREGDQIRVSAKAGKRPPVDRQAVRVFGLNVSIDDDTGNEKLQQLQLSP